MAPIDVIRTAAILQLEGGKKNNIFLLFFSSQEVKGPPKWELLAECGSPCVPSLAVMKCHAWRNRPNLGLQTQFPTTDVGELEVNELGDDVGAETRGGSSWLWRIDMANEGWRGGGEVGDDGGRQPGGTERRISCCSSGAVADS